MKVSVILALPALALAAATPAVEERQLPVIPSLPGLPLNPTCLLRITGITTCVPGGVDADTLLSDLLGCPVRVILSALDCIISGVPLPVKE
ncbi:hypothetical protein HYQ45_003825 [Verticillium longisporum]|uniref:Hydrophobin n=1 Tax=Verticillium longisporum TaxID=100787 RepID=A0A0G4LIW5_VERLO|nr:hypothetical protein HYQ44_006622 [Verticillium longisporum]KAG7139153.1 hypothetical protein HYQ45_003825 [Verticillium longisporum]CRK21953.1 hypothetical protein BN1708_003534 [Verticillium longisporum]